MTEERCRACLERARLTWNSTADSDLAEGLCPKKTEDEVYVCEETGQRITPTGVVHIHC
jgi:hypothetical protein